MATKTVTVSLEGDGSRFVALTGGVAEIRHAYLVHAADGEEHYDEVVVTGPDESPDALGQRAATHSA